MSFTDETVRFEFDDSSKKEIGETLVSVYKSLGEKDTIRLTKWSVMSYPAIQLIFRAITMLETKSVVLTAMISLKN